MMKIGILIIGYRNVQGIRRLLHSLNGVDFESDHDIDLIFSIDYSGDTSVEEIAKAFEWKSGKKHIIAYNENLGLKKHILICGNYIEEFGLDAIIVLEDDLFLSPDMYRYVKAAVAFYQNDSRIAGISLYKHEYNINAKHPFYDYNDGGDTYFMQYAMSWGQVWLKNSWKDFIQWYEAKSWKKMNTYNIPKNLMTWKNSWLKFHIMYCIDKQKYFVYPRQGYSTDFSDVGTHNAKVTTAMQIPLCIRKKGDWCFNTLDNTSAVYDGFWENLRVKEYLKLENLVVDLFGVKVYPDTARYVVTRRILPYQVICSWGLYLRPIEANIFSNIHGEEIFLYDLSIRKISLKRQGLKHRYFEYDLKGINLMNFETIRYCTDYFKAYLKMKILKK